MESQRKDPDTAGQEDYLIEVMKRYEKWISEGELSIPTKVIPIKESFQIQQQILPTEQAEEILRSARSVALTHCACRTRYGYCENPIQTCLIINQVADKRVAENRAKSLSLEEAFDVLRIANEKGLVHLTIHKPAKILAYDSDEMILESSHHPVESE